jgi:predicted ribosomally synthesized peptide with nif11-like leader
MGEAATSQFFERMKTDESLRNEYNSAITNAMRSAVWPAMVDVATRHGFQLTKEDLGRYVESRADELGERELETISGGGPSAFVSLTTSPLVVSSIIASTIAIPEAIHDGEDDST